MPSCIVSDTIEDSPREVTVRLVTHAEYILGPGRTEFRKFFEKVSH